MNCVMRVKVSEAGPINDMLPCVPRFWEADQVGHGYRGRFYLVGGPGAVTGCHIDVSYIVRESEYGDPTWIIGRVSLCWGVASGEGHISKSHTAAWR